MRWRWPSFLSEPGVGIALAIVAACTVARSAVFVVYEHSNFDSDQAIFGLMTKHLIEGRAFPLFYYGQAYLLALDAYFAVPFFVVLGPTVLSLHTSFLAANVIAGTLCFVALTRSGGVRPLEATLALSFFTLAPPLLASDLLVSGSIWSFVVVTLLWMLRRRPAWCGLTLAIGVLYREFVIYALPVLLLGDWMNGRLRRAKGLREWALALGVAATVWVGVQALTPYADLMGPGTRGVPTPGQTSFPIENILIRMNVTPSEYPARTIAMVRDHLPRLLGARRVEADLAIQGHESLLPIVWVGLPVIFVGALFNARRAGFARAAFGWYLIGVGALSVLGYVATRPAGTGVDRYYLFALLVPVGIVAVSFAMNHGRIWRLATVAVVAVWVAGTSVDHLVQVRRYWGGAERNDIRMLADGLVARDIRLAKASYWRAYKLTFLTEERVKIATTEVVRIEEYQRLAEAAGTGLLHIGETRCEGGVLIGPWTLCRQ